jgi:hypothetical protein
MKRRFLFAVVAACAFAAGSRSIAPKASRQSGVTGIVTDDAGQPVEAAQDAASECGTGPYGGRG